MMRFFLRRGGCRLAGLLASVVLAAHAQNPLVIYTDGLVNGFDDWSYTTRNFANSSPVHGGTKSISVSPAGAYEAISFHHADFNNLSTCLAHKSRAIRISSTYWKRL